MANVVHENYKDEWETPPEFFARLNKVFDFKVDLFASQGNALCGRYRTRDCFIGNQADAGEWTWANPPYGKGLAHHVAECWGEYLTTGARAVMLLPANTDARWFHDLAFPHAHIVFIKGRLQFLLNGERQRTKDGKLSGNPGANILVIFGPNLLGSTSISARGAR